MKKTIIIVAITFFVTGLLCASQSWIGIQGTGSYKLETTTYTFLGLEAEEKHTAKLIGSNVTGAFYPNESPIGIGFQVGFAKTIDATKGSSDVDVSDYPLTWNGGITGNFSVPMTQRLALELGAGLSYESAVRIYDIGGDSDIETTLNTLNALASANLVISLPSNIAIVGGMGISMPLTTKANFEVGSITYTEDFDVKGPTINGQLGLALSF